MNETKNVSRRTRNPIFFRKDGGWKSVSTDCIVCMEACAYKCIFYMDDGTVKEVEMPLGTALAKAQEQATTFLRVHRSYAVNIEHIDMVYNDRRGQGTVPCPFLPDD
ncbi:MAG: LytTR family transcriptional regulator [Prevotella sp.]|nr:LytTR family transcriptional regulator [Prevotella sp.]